MRVRKGRVAIDIRGSLFCSVRERAQHPLCAFYAAAITRMMHLFGLTVDVGTVSCRATGSGTNCIMSLLVRAEARG
jgi:predicted hydrocarbon binding protein